MRPFIAARDWDGLEVSYRQLATELAGSDQAEKIAALDFHSYQTALCWNYAEAVVQALERRAKAIYFEYDLDNGWNSYLSIHAKYDPEGQGDDDDWGCEYIADVLGPRFPVAGALYDTSFAETPFAMGTTLYLVARTVAAYGRCSDKYPQGDFAVCIGFHDQAPVTRIREINHNSGPK